MALEPAGVSLEAQGFKDYIKNLDAIEKKQRAAFEAEFKGTGKSFAEVTRAAKLYEKQLEDVAKAEQAAARESEKAARSQVKAAQRVAQEQRKLAEAQKIARATQQQAFISAGQATLGFIQQVGGAAIESGKLAAQFQGQRMGLDNLAASFGQSGSEIQSAIQTASKGTISGLDSIQAANTALLFGVAKTPEQFSTLTNSALTLGRTLGLTGTQAIEQFTTALGRQSLLILDNFGISAKQVNAEIERLAQADFGVAKSQLTEAQKQATFMKAALSIAGEAAAIIGDEAGNAQASFDRLTAASENLQVTFGAAIQTTAGGIADKLAEAAVTAQKLIAILSGGFTAIGTIAKGVFGETLTAFSKLGQLIKGEISFAEFREPLREFDDIVREATEKANERFKQVASTITGVSFDSNADKLAQDLSGVSDGADEAAQSLDGYKSALQQAENLQLSFSRAAEDTALKLARANEDIARKQGQQIAKLGERQAKDRDKLLKDQAKQLDRFEADRRKQISKAEGDIQKARRDAAEKRKSDQKKLQRELAQAQEKFNLSQLQSERRFNLSESRLRAEGDILALQQLREDRALERQEEKENFDQSQKDRVKSAEETQKDQAKDLDNQIKELKTNLEDQRAELLSSFDEQLAAQQEAQAQAQAAQQLAFQEQAAERQIQLQREEEDRRISQARQLEDLGRSLAEQEGVTAEGSAAIAGQLEKVFGIEGTADNIMTGFTTKTENEFSELFKNLEKIVSEAELDPPRSLSVPSASTGSGGFGRRIGGVQEFQDGGVVAGPLGSPQAAIVHAGETVLPTHQRSFTMAAPVIPSQSLEVNMSGGFNISGDGQSNDAILQAATAEMTENFRIAVRRLARRN